MDGGGKVRGSALAHTLALASLLLAPLLRNAFVLSKLLFLLN